VVVPERAQPLDVLVADSVAGGYLVVEGTLDVEGVEERDAVEDQAECGELLLLAVAVGLAQLPEAAVEDPRAGAWRFSPRLS
jgi:hypothetical protein